MNKYRVTVIVSTAVHPEVEAHNEDEAMQAAERAAEHIINGWLSFQAVSVKFLKGEESE